MGAGSGFRDGTWTGHGPHGTDTCVGGREVDRTGDSGVCPRRKGPDGLAAPQGHGLVLAPPVDTSPDVSFSVLLSTHPRGVGCFRPLHPVPDRRALDADVDPGEVDSSMTSNLGSRGDLRSPVGPGPRNGEGTSSSAGRGVPAPGRAPHQTRPRPHVQTQGSQGGFVHTLGP